MTCLDRARENLALVKSRHALASQMETQLGEETGQLTRQMRTLMQDLNCASRALSLAQRKREDLKQSVMLFDENIPFLGECRLMISNVVLKVAYLINFFMC